MITGATMIRRTFRDRCQVMTRRSEDESLEPLVVWDTGEDIACRVDNSDYIRNEVDGAQVPGESVWIRLPIDTIIERTSRVRVTELWGHPINYRDYAVVGDPVITPDCISVFGVRIVGQNIF